MRDQLTATRVPSFLNYSGSKFKLLPTLFPYLDHPDRKFTDLFCGGGIVGLNMGMLNPTQLIHLNDSQPQLMALFAMIKDTKTEDLVESVIELIYRYGLSDTYGNSYAYYGADSSIGLAKINKEAFIQLRSDYNAGAFAGRHASVVFYTLIVFAFNNQIRFNGRGEYNLPVGKRDFNTRMREKLIRFAHAIKTVDPIISNKDFRSFPPFGRQDLVYCDPPYSISTASYNENGLWTFSHDEELFSLLDSAHAAGAKFVLSNISEHKGVVNTPLLKWAESYSMVNLKFNYNNSNYQSSAKRFITQEVVVHN